MGLNYKGKYEFPIKQFFWASSDYEFKELPDLMIEYCEEVDSFRSALTGDEKLILIQVKGGT